MNKLFCYTRRLLHDPDARHGMATLFGMIFNSSYAIWCLLVGILNKDSWFIAVAAFYTLAPVVRYLSIDGRLSQDGRRALYVLLLYVACAMSWVLLRASLYNELQGLTRRFLPVLMIYASLSILYTVYSLGHSRGRSRSLSYALRLSLLLILFYNLQSAFLFYIGLRDSVKNVFNTITASAVSISLFHLAKRSGAR